MHIGQFGEMQEVWSSLSKLLNVLVFFQLKEERARARASAPNPCMWIVLVLRHRSLTGFKDFVGVVDTREERCNIVRPFPSFICTFPPKNVPKVSNGLKRLF